MAKHDKYHPDYSKLYPGIESRPEILAVLKQSDRKMKYIEVDLKTERPVYSKKAGRIIFRPSREDSFERLCEDEHIQFASDDSSLEEELAHKDKLRRRALEASGEDQQLQNTEAILEYLEDSGRPFQRETVDEELFEFLIQRLTVYSAETVKFRLYNGLELAETMERAVR